MSPPHRPGPNYSDYWWEDLPEKARRAAIVLGYSKETWDDDATIPYDSKTFAECSYSEKNAAMYLHMSPIEKKLDIWWDDADDETKRLAQVLGWDKHKWDDDWAIEQLPCEHWWWRDMTEEQQKAARHFGYGRGTWDYVEDEEEDFEPTNTTSKPPASANPAKIHPMTQAAHGNAAGEGSTAKPFQLSASYGGDGGDEFDHMNQRAINEIIIYADRHHVNGIKMVYNAHTKMTGSEDGSAHEFQLHAGELITKVKVRSNRFVQCLTFTTNKGRDFGPCGGKGWLIGNRDKPGTEAVAVAPSGYQLCGIKGRAGNCIDQITFRWGPQLE